MNDQFASLLRDRSVAAVGWAARTFATGSTFRIFRKKTSRRVRKLLALRIGDGKSLVRGAGQPSHTRALVREIDWFRDHVQTNSRMGNKKPNFGQAAKLVNLYVKPLIGLPHALLPHKEKLERNVHVILDNVILKSMWGNRKLGIGPFKQEMEAAGFNRLPQLSGLTKSKYLKLQNIVAEAARKTGRAPIVYDYVWALRPL
jgi:hypothetical protein